MSGNTFFNTVSTDVGYAHVFYAGDVALVDVSFDRNVVVPSPEMRIGSIGCWQADGNPALGGRAAAARNTGVSPAFGVGPATAGCTMGELMAASK